MKKFLSLVLSLVLLRGCVPASAERFSTEGFVFHKADEPVTFSIAVPHNFLTDPATEDPYIVEMSEATNIHFEFEVIPTADKSTRVNLMLASEDYPDATTGSLLSESQIISLGESGILVDLKPYMTAEYMPNLTKLLETYPDLLTAITLENGGIYTLPSAEVNWYDTYAGIHVNQKWLEKVGKTMPTTLDEFADLLVAFKEQDPNGNGEADEIPLAFKRGKGTHTYGIAGWFGTTDQMMYIDGKAIFGPTEENFREYVRYMNRLWELGVMDIEVFTQDESTFKAKGQQATTVYGVVADSAPDYWTTSDKKDDYALLTPIDAGTGRYGALKQRVSDKYYNLKQAAIFNNGQDIPTLLKWFDNHYDPYYGEIISKGFLNGNLVETEGHKLAFCAPEDVPEQFTNATDWMSKTHIQQWPCARIKYYDEYFTSTGVVNQLKAISDFLSTGFYNETMPYGFTYPAEQAVYDEYLTDITKYVAEKFAAWVTGEADLDAEWDAFQAQLKALHVDELVAGYQAQYDRLTGK